MDEQARKWAGPAVPADNWQALADRYAICELGKIYAVALDARDYDLCRTAFAPDATAEGREGMEPIDTYLPGIYGMASSWHATQHLIANQYVTINGDDAELWSYGIAHHKVGPGETRDEIIAGVQYRDLCRRFPEGWLITERRMVLQWLDKRAPSPAF